MKLLEQRGFEPLTPCVQGRCSPAELLPPLNIRIFSLWAQVDSNH